MTPVVSLFCSFPVLENFQVPEFNAWWLSSRWPQRFHVWKDVLSGLIEIQFLERANKKLSKLKPKWVEVGLLICRCVDQSSLETDEVLALGLRTQWEFFFKKQCHDCNGCGLEMTGLAKGLKKLRWQQVTTVCPKISFWTACCAYLPENAFIYWMRGWEGIEGALGISRTSHRSSVPTDCRAIMCQTWKVWMIAAHVIPQATGCPGDKCESLLGFITRARQRYSDSSRLLPNIAKTFFFRYSGTRRFFSLKLIWLSTYIVPFANNFMRSCVGR